MKKKPSEKAISNLRPRTTLSKEEAKEMGRLGGLKSVIVRREKKTLTENLKLLLEQDHKIKDQVKTGSEWLTVSLFQKALKGDVTAQKMIFDRIEGITPQDINIDEKQEITLNIIKRNE